MIAVRARALRQIHTRLPLCCVREQIHAWLFLLLCADDFKPNFVRVAFLCSQHDLLWNENEHFTALTDTHAHAHTRAHTRDDFVSIFSSSGKWWRADILLFRVKEEEE